MPQFSSIELDQQQEYKDEMSVDYESTVMNLAMTYIGDAAIPDLLEKISDLNDKYNKYVDDIESGGYDG
ncbi:hypothetical protein [Weissella koreensis]|uniref:hypothetical protein n=1 Tax=Weissella koreensis TaxID=165096 RepID=UPI000CF32FEE|nr:hypothetical protein [Weissella koreensis]AVH74736.1 hypothetical protein C4597_01305 [Weissella koreensis]QGN19960.1 hypothetical protein GKC51_01285 [Weissella koreensis]